MWTTLLLLASFFGCKVGAFPTFYLGLPLTSNSKDIWNPVIEKFERRLAGWKRLFIESRYQVGVGVNKYERWWVRDRKA